MEQDELVVKLDVADVTVAMLRYGTRWEAAEVISAEDEDGPVDLCEEDCLRAMRRAESEANPEG